MAGRATSLPEGGVREASVREALAIIEQDGLEKLSLRDVARRLGVSHQAPYKYFPTRDHLLAEVIGRCFDDFGDQLEAAATGEADLETALMAMGARYLDYAAKRPSAYRLMFAFPLPSGETHPEMAARASKAFHALRGAVLRLHLHHGR
ncbi:MAG: TetR/AcrR family transcriptional regulator, partial [Phenylobacterium sp.]|nr:TetR/AcrR family transcriptional regulator [Phenylobacterium sp.]